MTGCLVPRLVAFASESENYATAQHGGGTVQFGSPWSIDMSLVEEIFNRGGFQADMTSSC